MSIEIIIFALGAGGVGMETCCVMMRENKRTLSQRRRVPQRFAEKNVWEKVTGVKEKFWKF